MRIRVTTTIALAACLAAAAGCGGDDKGRAIPAETRQELQKQLTSVENRFEAAGGACADITENQASVEKTLDSLPADVDAEVKDALSDGFGRLFDLTADQCDEQKGQETDTEPTEEPPPAITTEEAPPPAETQPETQPEQDGGGESKGNGKGNGNGGGNGGADNGGGLQLPGDGSGGAAPGEG
jgi:hypothetical protein